MTEQPITERHILRAELAEMQVRAMNAESMLKSETQKLTEARQEIARLRKALEAIRDELAGRDARLPSPKRMVWDIDQALAGTKEAP